MPLKVDFFGTCQGKEPHVNIQIPKNASLSAFHHVNERAYSVETCANDGNSLELQTNNKIIDVY